MVIIISKASQTLVDMGSVTRTRLRNVIECSVAAIVVGVLSYLPSTAYQFIDLGRMKGLTGLNQQVRFWILTFNCTVKKSRIEKFI